MCCSVPPSPACLPINHHDEAALSSPNYHLNHSSGPLYSQFPHHPLAVLHHYNIQSHVTVLWQGIPLAMSTPSIFNQAEARNVIRVPFLFLVYDYYFSPLSPTSRYLTKTSSCTREQFARRNSSKCLPLIKQEREFVSTVRFSN